MVRYLKLGSVDVRCASVTTCGTICCRCFHSAVREHLCARDGSSTLEDKKRERPRANSLFVAHGSRRRETKLRHKAPPVRGQLKHILKILGWPRARRGGRGLHYPNVVTRPVIRGIAEKRRQPEDRPGQGGGKGRYYQLQLLRLP